MSGMERIHLANAFLIIFLGVFMAYGMMGAYMAWREAVGSLRYVFGFVYFAIPVFWGWVCYSQGAGL